MLSIMQDDNALVYGGAPRRDAALDRMKALGVDSVRVTVLWEALAPKRRINGSDPRAYKPQVWDKYDGIVRAATARGITPYLDLTYPGPRWAQPKAPRAGIQRTWMPDAMEFGRFVAAVGKRYEGGYTDENEGRRQLPKVGLWAIGNEPNQGGWLEPQTQVVKGAGRTPLSPGLYRDLLVEGAGGLLRTGHREDLVMIGETAPLGVAPASERRPLRPALFIREMFCLDKGLRRYTGKRAAARNCRNVRKLRILKRFRRLAFAHHPYTKTQPPHKRDRSPESFTMANISTLPKLLDRIAARTGLIPGNLRILLTEFGYETTPPDPFNGITPDLQAKYINQADYLAYKDPRIYGTTQFQLLDVPPQTQYPKDSRLYWFTYQSGLFTAADQPKPAAGAYALPFDIEPSGGSKTLWGQVRFTPNGAKQTVYLQQKVGGSFQNIGGPIRVINPFGYWELQGQTVRGATYRVVWVSEDGSRVAVSREVLGPP